MTIDRFTSSDRCRTGAETPRRAGALDRGKANETEPDPEAMRPTPDGRFDDAFYRNLFCLRVARLAGLANQAESLARKIEQHPRWQSIPEHIKEMFRR